MTVLCSWLSVVGFTSDTSLFMTEQLSYRDSALRFKHHTVSFRFKTTFSSHPEMSSLTFNILLQCAPFSLTSDSP